MVKSITVYSRSTCAPCKMLKAYLAHKGMAFNELNIDENPEAQKKAFEMTGYSIVPLTIVEQTDGTRSIITGYNIAQLASLFKV